LKNGVVLVPIFSVLFRVFGVPAVKITTEYTEHTKKTLSKRRKIRDRTGVPECKLNRYLNAEPAEPQSPRRKISAGFAGSALKEILKT